MQVHVNPVFDLGITAHDVTVTPGQTGGITLPVSLTGVGVDSSESLADISFTLPAGWTATGYGLTGAQAGIGTLTHNADGTTGVSIPQSLLATTRIEPPAGFKGDTHLTLHATLTDSGVDTHLDLPITLTVVSPNIAPTVTASAAAPADLGATLEDTSKTFTEADLLRMVGAHDADAGNVLHVGSVTVDPKFGAFSKDAVMGDWTFTPAADFHGDQVPLTISVTDGTTSTDAHAKLAVTAVDDVLTVAADATHPAAMPDIAVNTETTFTKAQLLQLVGATDPDGDALSITEVHIDPRAGYFAPLPNGDFIFKPVANFHADDLDITLKVTDGTSTIEAHAQLDIKATPGQLKIDSVDNALHTASSFETTAADLTIHGSAVGLPDGTPITVHLADKNHPENTFDLQTAVTGGSWSLSFNQSKVLAPGNHDWSVSASATDLFGTQVNASTKVIYQDAPTASAQHGAAATTLDLLSGSIAGTAVQHVQYSSDGGRSWSDQVPAGFTLAADGHTLQVDPTSSAFSSLAHGQQQQVQVRYEMAQAGDPSATIHQTASVTITGSNHGPTVTAVDAGHAANLGATAEDTARTFTEADLIRMVGGSDADHDSLHVAAVRISPEYGSFAHDAASGAWTFTPAANYDGSHLPISIEVTDGQATATSHAMIDITPVADTPVLGVSLGAVQMTAAAGAAAQQVDAVSPGAAYGPTVPQDFGGMYGHGAGMKPADDSYIDELKAIVVGGHIYQVIGIQEVDNGSGVLQKVAVLDVSGSINDLIVSGGQTVTFIFNDNAPHTSMQWELKVYNRPGDAGYDYINDMAGWSPIAVDRLAHAAPSDSHFTASIPEDTGVELNITLSDPDASEHLSLQVAGLPQGATLSAGTHNADGSWTLAPGDLPGLIMTPPQDYSGDIHLTVKATSTEPADHSLSAEKVVQLDISVDPVAEKPSLSVADLADSQEHSGAVALDIHVDVHHDDGETLSITIENLPPGAVLSAGTDNHDGSWTLSPAQLQGLKITPEADWSGSFALKVTATSTEATGERTQVIQFVGGAVHSVLDSTIAVHDATLAVNMDDVRSVHYGQSLPLHWSAGTDHGERVVSNVGGHEGRFRLDIPNGGWKILDNANHICVLLDANEQFVFDPVNKDGDYHIFVAPEDLDSLTFIPPQGYQGESTFRLTGEIMDEGASHMVDMPFKVTVGSPAPAPAPQADAIDDQPIDTADSVVADDGSAVTAQAGDGSATGVDAHAVAPSAEAAHHDAAAPVGTDDSAHIATTEAPGSNPPAESPTADHLASSDANPDGAVTSPSGEEAHTATADTLISHDAIGALTPEAPTPPDTIHDLGTSAPASPLADYLHFADTSHGADAAGVVNDDSAYSPLGDYLAAAGVDATTATTTDAADLPPTEVLLTAGQELPESHGAPGSEHDPASQPVDLPAEVGPDEHHQHHQHH
ncbi:cadherin-like domain-containing protein [Aeromonas sp. 164P]